MTGHFSGPRRSLALLTRGEGGLVEKKEAPPEGFEPSTRRLTAHCRHSPNDEVWAPRLEQCLPRYGLRRARYLASFGHLDRGIERLSSLPRVPSADFPMIPSQRDPRDLNRRALTAKSHRYHSLNWMRTVRESIGRTTAPTSPPSWVCSPSRFPDGDLNSSRIRGTVRWRVLIPSRSKCPAGRSRTTTLGVVAALSGGIAMPIRIRPLGPAIPPAQGPTGPCPVCRAVLATARLRSWLYS